MYTLYIDDENSITITEKDTIMERSNYVDNIQILVDRYYRGNFDMSCMSCYMRYVLPVSGQIRNMELKLNDMAYNDEDVLQYTLPANTVFTSEAGDIEISLTWLMVQAHDDGSYTEYVRKTQEGIITIVPLAQFAKYVPNHLLDEIDQRLLAMNAQIEDLNSLMASAYDSIPLDVTLDDDKGHIVLINKDGIVGEGVSMDELTDIFGVAIAGLDPDGVTDGVIDLDKIVSTIINLDSIVPRKS